LKAFNGQKLGYFQKIQNLRLGYGYEAIVDVLNDCNQHIISSSSSSSALGSEENVLSEESRVKLNEEKKRRAQLLQLNHELAKEVMERSRIVAVLAQLTKYDNKSDDRFEEMKNISEKDLIEMIEREWPQTNRHF